MRRLWRCIGLVICGGLWANPGAAQTFIDPGAGDLLHCIAQVPPAPASWRLVVNGAPPVPLTMDAALNSLCPSEATHSFRRPGSGYTLGNYIEVVQSVTTGGQITSGPEFQFAVEPRAGKAVISDEASVGLVQVFLEAGYEVVASPTLRRRVVRRRLGNHT